MINLMSLHWGGGQAAQLVQVVSVSGLNPASGNIRARVESGVNSASVGRGRSKSVSGRGSNKGMKGSGGNG